jgi:hypothetical protein
LAAPQRAYILESSSAEMTSSYVRSTRAVPLTAFPPPLLAAVQGYAHNHQLLLDRIRCWLTTSQNPPAEGFFGKMLGRRANPVDPDPWHQTAIVLHPTHVLVGTYGERRGVAVLGAALDRMSLTRGSAMAARLAGRLGAAAQAAADGVSLDGFPGDQGQVGSLFVGIGPEPDGQACIEAIEQAIVHRKNPT